MKSQMCKLHVYEREESLCTVICFAVLYSLKLQCVGECNFK